MKLPPIVGDQPLPVKDRPKCLYCKKPLRPYMSVLWGKGTAQRIGREFNGSYGLHGLFCGPRHAEQWGLAIAFRLRDVTTIALKWPFPKTS